MTVHIRRLKTHKKTGERGIEREREREREREEINCLKKEYYLRS